MSQTLPREIFRVQHDLNRTIKVRQFVANGGKGLDIVIQDARPAKTVIAGSFYGPADVTAWFEKNSAKNVDAWKAAYWKSGLGQADFQRPLDVHAALASPRPRGMHPDAFAAYGRAFADSGMAPMRIVQTCTGALGARVAASAGTHDADGQMPGGEAYSVSVDLSTWRVRGVIRWDEKHLKWALFNLADEGFACWYRHTGSFAHNLHIHALYLGLHMKPVSQNQAIDFLNGRTGLVNHYAETFYTPSRTVDAKLTEMFLRSNPECRGRV